MLQDDLLSVKVVRYIWWLERAMSDVPFSPGMTDADLITLFIKGTGLVPSAFRSGGLGILGVEYFLDILPGFNAWRLPRDPLPPSPSWRPEKDSHAANTIREHLRTRIDLEVGRQL